MNYIKLLNTFRDYTLLNKLPTSCIVLYHALLQIANMHRWQKTFPAPSNVLQQLTGLSRQRIIDARSHLKAVGFISFSTSSNQACAYQILDSKPDTKPYSKPDSKHDSLPYNININKNVNNLSKNFKQRPTENYDHLAVNLFVD